MSVVSKKVTLEDAKDILLYHKELFGIKEDLKKTQYVMLSAKIFHIINLFSIVDEAFSDELLCSLVNDIVILLKYFEIGENKTDSIINECKEEAVLVINTKLFYLDILIWERVESSKAIKSVLRQMSVLGVKNSIELFTSLESGLNFVLEPKYNSTNPELKAKYEISDLENIKSLANFRERRKNTSLRALIKSKNQISFFQDMDIEDIKHTVTNVAFAKYKTYEKIIEENSDTTEIFFLMSGTCKVSIGRNSVGIIEKNQIFGEFSSITKQKRAATVTADEPVTVLRFNFHENIFDKDPYPFTMLHKNIINELLKKIDSININKHF